MIFTSELLPSESCNNSPLSVLMRDASWTLSGRSKTWKTSIEMSPVCGERFLAQRRKGAKKAAKAIKRNNNVDLRNISALRDHRLMLAFPVRLRLARYPRRVLTVPTRHACGIRTQPARRDHSFKRQITQRISFDKLPYLLDTHVRRDQL